MMEIENKNPLGTPDTHLGVPDTPLTHHPMLDEIQAIVRAAITFPERNTTDTRPATQFHL